jgi:5-oxoprolinase (ATP-hydrolysing) subunit A
MTIDLNCDMGEGLGNDALIMPWITSANIACGFHAGDDDTMKRTIELALQHNVAIGAHPSFNDKENFGRTEMNVNETALHDLVTTQVHRLMSIAATYGNRLHHVKPHGAMYNMAAKDELMSHIIAKAIKQVDAGLILYGLSNSHLIKEAKKIGLRTASEVFADRTYTDDGHLTPRSEPNALIEEEERSLEQVLKIVTEKKVISATGKIINIDAGTICIHGDGIHAVAFAKKISEMLKQNNIEIKTI